MSEGKRIDVSQEIGSSAPGHRPYVTTEDHPVVAVYGAEAPAPPRTLVDIFRATVVDHPEALALEAATGSLTYRELHAAVLQRAAQLRSAGVRRGDRVGVRVPSGTLDLYVAILAIIHAGAAYVPVDWDDPDERADTVFTEAAVAAVIGAEFSITSGPGAGSDPSRDLGGGDPTPTPDDDAWIIFTSGSTGKPKGVAIRHRSAAAWVDAENALYLQQDPMRPGDRVMAGLSVAFDASCEEMWIAWSTGATLVAAPREVVRSGPDLGDWIVRHDITVVSTVPTLASLWPAEALDAVRLLIFGGEACPQELVEALMKPEREIWNSYGPTETTVIVCGHVMQPHPPVRIGRPIKGWQLAVVEPATGRPVEWGQTGELVVGGVGLGRYLDPEKDAEKYTPLPSLGWDRAYWTGDIVRAEHEGLVFVGRTDDQIKLGGKRIELGEVDDHLMSVPGVRMAAAALKKTAAGADVLVGYLTEDGSGAFDLGRTREMLAARLPGGTVPVLAVMDELPMATSGKVNRKALPWPLPEDASAGDDEDGGLSPGERWLKGLWVDQLGPMPIDATTNFFEIGGGSVQLARLVAAVRTTHPSAEIGRMYAHPTLAEMTGYLESLTTTAVRRPMPAKLPRGPKLFQAAFVTAVYSVHGLRYVTAAFLVMWVLRTVLDAPWVPQIPFWPVLVAWLVVFSTPGKVAQAGLVARTLTAGIRPGTYPRGGWVHVRVWAAERFFETLRLEPLDGTGMARVLHRAMGSRVGKGASVSARPAVSGFVTIGDGAVVEEEVDLLGHWIDGDRFVIGTIEIRDDARVGARSIVTPGVVVGERCEVRPGSHVNRDLPADTVWGGAPVQEESRAGLSWPEQRRLDDPSLQRWGPALMWCAELLGVALITLLPVAAMTPGAIIIYSQVREFDQFRMVAPVLAAWIPLLAILTAFTWLGLVIIAVRILAGWIVPGYFRQDSGTGWAVWLTHALLQRTLTSTYPVYASSITPLFLRLMGAHVGRDAEISTIETVPRLTWLRDRTFIADHALVTSTRRYRGWVHVGTTVIGEGAFVGNSAIVGPDTDLPRDALIAVLSSTSAHAPAGSSWLGRPPNRIPRVRTTTADEVTYAPPARIKAARAAVESFRIVPLMIALWLDLILMRVLDAVYMGVLRETDSQLQGVLTGLVVALPLTVLSGIVATLVAVAAKWVLVGKFKEQDRPLFNSFVWRGELADVFAESLAVPSLVRLSIGSPLFSVYARLMGSRIGRDVWCETWWLPEFDLVHLGDRATVNKGTVVQTHLFQDRVMTMVRTRMEPGSTLGVNSFMLPGSVIGERASVGIGSLVQRGESIPADTHWEGNPAQFIPAHPDHSSPVRRTPHDRTTADTADSPRPAGPAGLPGPAGSPGSPGHAGPPGPAAEAGRPTAAGPAHRPGSFPLDPPAAPPRPQRAPHVAAAVQSAPAQPAAGRPAAPPPAAAPPAAAARARTAGSRTA